MCSLIVVTVSLITNIIIFYLMYKGIYIPSGKMPLIFAVFIAVLYYGLGYLFGEVRGSRVTRLFIFSITLYVSFTLGSLTYENWKWISLISSFSMMKITLVFLLLVIIYLNIIYIRAEISYKRKRGNIRIQDEKPENHIKSWIERRRGKEEHEISIQLGKSTEAEEKAPPI